MKKFVIALVISAPMLLLSGCGYNTITYQTVAYDPGYANDYVYSVSNYGNRSCWGNTYCYTCGLKYYGYWGGSGYCY